MKMNWQKGQFVYNNFVSFLSVDFPCGQKKSIGIESRICCLQTTDNNIYFISVEIFAGTFIILSSLTRRTNGFHDTLYSDDIIKSNHIAKAHVYVQ